MERTVQDSVTGMLLAGIGHVTPAPNSSKNFLVVDAKTEVSEIEKAFEEFTTRKDVGILLINQHVSSSCMLRAGEGEAKADARWGTDC